MGWMNTARTLNNTQSSNSAATRQRSLDAARAQAEAQARANPKSPTLASPLRKDQSFVGNQYRMDKNLAALGSIAPMQSLSGEYDSRLSGIGGQNVGLGAMRTEATRKGPSAWLNLEMDRNRAEEGLGLSNLASAQAGQLAQARSSLASRRGLSSGAAERLAGGGARDNVLAQQGMRSQAMLGRMGLSSQDEANRLNMLSGLTGAEQAQNQFDMSRQMAALAEMDKTRSANYNAGLQERGEKINAFDVDIRRSLEGLGQKSAFGMDKYKTQMQDWAANQQANAMANSGGGGGLLSSIFG